MTAIEECEQLWRLMSSQVEFVMDDPDTSGPVTIIVTKSALYQLFGAALPDDLMRNRIWLVSQAVGETFGVRCSLADSMLMAVSMAAVELFYGRVPVIVNSFGN